MSRDNNLRSPVDSQAMLAISVLAIAGIAWFALWYLGHTLHGSVHVHEVHVHDHAAAAATPQVPSMILFIAGWTMMTVAMMLPTTVPLLTVFRTITGQKPSRVRLTILVCLGYVVAWIGFGVLVFLAKTLLENLASSSEWLSRYSWAMTAALLIMAGVFQFTQLKYRCLDKCRSPLSFVITHWRGERDSWHSFRLGVDHGVYCIGCCWALMLLMFVVGAGSLPWMIVLALVMGVEKNVRWGRKLSAPLGVLLICAGLVALVRGPLG